MFSTALAQEVADVAPQSSILSFAPLLVLLAVFYFFILRPQQKKTKEEAQMRSSIRIGDKIVTTAGIFGSVSKIDDEKGVISMEISKGVEITIYKASISEVLTKKENESPKTDNDKK